MPRAGLSHAAVVDAAQRLSDEVGLANLTLTALADELGVRQPSLYKHVDSLAHLHRSLAVRAKTELAAVLASAAAGRAGADAVLALATAYREWARAHPGRYAATVRAPDPDDVADVEASAAAVSVVTRVLESLGVEGDAVVHATRALRAALHGYVAIEAAGGFALPVDVDESFRRMVQTLVAGLVGGSGDGDGPA